MAEVTCVLIRRPAEQTIFTHVQTPTAEITGFKSFADYTEILFTGDGITAVVGPNGCGKSNVADAIAWVLGEQRVKHLRGAEMKDVIFQGSRDRQPSGMAEVVMHMVRDEVIESEPDIEDIDSTVESNVLDVWLALNYLISHHMHDYFCHAAWLTVA